MNIDAPGISITLPAGWEAEVDHGAGEVEPGMETVVTPRVHIANFPLPPDRGDFGSNAVERMLERDVLICLLEESIGAAGSQLHGHAGVPRLQAQDFSPSSMQRAIKGQSGTQVFFQDQGRAFVLYVVVGSHLSRAGLIDGINQVLAGITIHPR